MKIKKIFFKKLLFIKNKLINGFFLLPLIQKPFPKNPFGLKPRASKEKYLSLFNQTINKNNILVDKFEKNLNFSINKKWFNELSLITQTCIKESDLNFNHGKILYSLLSKYISNNKNKLNITILETGTARGFSSICMSKALNDQKINGKVITLDCIPHNEKIFWNCIVDHEGKKTRRELLEKWRDELSNIIFIQGWTIDTLRRLGISRVNFAFLDAQHTKRSVMEEFLYIQERQVRGDIIFFDDVTPNLFNGVCEAIKEIEKFYPYKIQILDFDKNRGYAVATRI